MKPIDFCNQHDACSEGVRFAVQYATMAEGWDNCPRADWLVWVLERTGKELDRKSLRLFACWCVRNTPLADGRKVWDLLTDERSRNAVIVAEKFAVGEATEQGLRKARSDAAYAAGASYAAASAASAAAYAAYAYAAYAAAAAADAASYAAAYAAAFTVALGAADAQIKARAFQADQFRLMFPNPFTS